MTYRVRYLRNGHLMTEAYKTLAEATQAADRQRKLGSPMCWVTTVPAGH
jgi:hypothetical protein